VDTLNDMVSPPDPGSGAALPPPPPGSSTPSAARRRWRVAGIVVATVAIVLVVQVIVAAQLDTPWIAFEPGSATSTDGLLTVDGAQTYDDAGQILYLTVRQNRLTALEWVMKSRDPYIDIERESDIYPNLSPEDVRNENAQLMVRSKSDAELVALQYLGYDVFQAAGATVADVAPGTPAEEKLEVGDVITAVDGVEVMTSEALVAQLKTLQPGTTVTLVVGNADGTDERTVEVTLAARPDGTAGGYLGISASTNAIENPDVPVTVDIDSGEVGGNSAGLAFSLSIIDTMTPGSLTGDHTVAVTGTMSLDGAVGDVGGVAQKAVAARRAGADYMLVPRNLEQEALKNAGGMQIIPVSTLQEALDALAGLGGNAKDLALPGTTQPN
jgi:PDZ domain-containing protein